MLQGTYSTVDLAEILIICINLEIVLFLGIGTYYLQSSTVRYRYVMTCFNVTNSNKKISGSLKHFGA